MKKQFRVSVLVVMIALLLAALTVAPSAVGDEGTVLLDSTAQWRYLDDNTDPADGTSSRQSWTLPGYNDSKWKTGNGAFGSKNGSLGAISGCGTPTQLIELYNASNEAIPTYFFRTTFTVADLSSIKTLAFDMCGDDAIIVYLNGHVICDSRSSIPSAASGSNKYYASYTTAAQSFFMNLDDMAGILNEGKNTLAVELHNNSETSSDIYFKLNSITAYSSTPTVDFDSVVLCVGKDETERIVTWYSTASEGGKMYYSVADNFKDGDFTSTPDASVASCINATNKMGYYSHCADMSDLLPDTDYVYVLEVAGVRSDPYYFSTDPDGKYEFVFVGDPQISAQSHGDAWKDTLTKIKNDLGANLVVSAGDQVSTPHSEPFYSWLLADEIAGVTFAPSIGPVHDNPSVAFSEHFNLPNESDTHGVSVSGSNYWYKYNNTLFIHINTADGSAMTSGEHVEYIRGVLDENQDAAWKILVMHTSLFTTGKHAFPNENTIKSYRDVLAPALSTLDLDIVIGGHDHVYVRAHLMDGLEISDDVVTNNTVISPSGLFYLAASSSTGSKFYDQTTTDYFVAYDNYENRKSAVKFTVTDNALVMESYFLDNMEIFDTFTIYHEPHEHTPSYVAGEDPTCTATGLLECWVCDECGEMFLDSTCTRKTNEAGRKIAALGHDWADATCTLPKTCTRDDCDATRGKAQGHEVGTKATCTTAATCKTCAEPVGEPLVHTYDNDCDVECNVCADARTVPEHSDSDGDGLCDSCGTELEGGSSGGVIIAVTVAAAAALAVAAAAIVIIKKRRK